MDNRGWIPIQLIANFNRVKQQTHDVQLVREVLNLSELVEVQETFVSILPPVVTSQLQKQQAVVS